MIPGMTVGPVGHWDWSDCGASLIDKRLAHCRGLGGCSNRKKPGNRETELAVFAPVRSDRREKKNHNY